MLSTWDATGLKEAEDGSAGEGESSRMTALLDTKASAAPYRRVWNFLNGRRAGFRGGLQYCLLRQGLTGKIFHSDTGFQGAPSLELRDSLGSHVPSFEP